MPDTPYDQRIRVRAVVPHNGRYLFVQHKFNPSYWALPGGGLEHGETLENGITRELIEELGVKPIVGKLLYVQQLFVGTSEESLEFFFLVENGADYTDIDLSNTTHGAVELSKIGFIDPSVEYVLPDFLADLDSDINAHKWPRVYVRTSPSF